MTKKAWEDHHDETPAGQDYSRQPQWRHKLLTPAQLLVNDIRLETYRADHGPLLEVAERSAAQIIPEDVDTGGRSRNFLSKVTSNPIELQQFAWLEQEYGWIRNLRLTKVQEDAFDDAASAKVRWLHVSSRFPEYIKGFLWAMTDDLDNISESLRILDTTLQRQTRFSKHGKRFAPFCETLRSTSGQQEQDCYPMLISVPFLDWTVLGASPPLRFQVDKREGYQSSRTSAHVLRSILQYFYRLEDTTDREGSQVFAKHRPWRTNRELDLKVRQWYGQYPSALNVDELWILAIDEQHIVTFSSNQTWKSRWPPMQLTSRISDVSFRGIRNNFFRSEHKGEYTAMTHVIASLSGACGMMHRSFWSDLLLCLTDRYASYLGGLQYRLHRTPSTKLVMDLMAAQEELNIVIHITNEQIDMISTLRESVGRSTSDHDRKTSPTRHRRKSVSADEYDMIPPRSVQRRATFRDVNMSGLTDPLAQLLDNLQREVVDLQDLRDNTDRLVTRTIQLVNIRMEDHGKAILVFTVVTIVFLPLNFISSFFGMNTVDIRNMDQTQSLFWIVAVCVTCGVVGASIFLAFSGADIMERIGLWRDARREHLTSTTTVLRPVPTFGGEASFRVHGVGRDE